MQKQNLKSKKMKTKTQILLLLLLINPILTKASWSVFPWTLKIYDNIKIESIPYRIYEGGDLGITKVYKQNKLLYSIDDYFSNFVTASKTGEYFVAINFRLYRLGYNIVELDENGNEIPEVEKFSGEAIKIFKNGELIKTIDFSELQIDTSQLKKLYDRFYWQTENQGIRICPAIIKDNILKIVSIDDQILNIDLKTGVQLASERLETEKINAFVNLIPKRKFKVKQKGFPEKFLLPKLIDGRTIEEGLSQFLQLNPTYDKSRDSAILQIYFHTLLINREGKCEKCFVSSTKRENLNIEFGYDNDITLGLKIEDWIYRQHFEIKSIPKYTDKHVFAGFVYLKK